MTSHKAIFTRHATVDYREEEPTYSIRARILKAVGKKEKEEEEKQETPLNWWGSKVNLDKMCFIELLDFAKHNKLEVYVVKSTTEDILRDQLRRKILALKGKRIKS
jgi:hypothetical protein